MGHFSPVLHLHPNKEKNKNGEWSYFPIQPPLFIFFPGTNHANMHQTELLKIKSKVQRKEGD